MPSLFPDASDLREGKSDTESMENMSLDGYRPAPAAGGGRRNSLDKATTIKEGKQVAGPAGPTAASLTLPLPSRNVPSVTNGRETPTGSRSSTLVNDHEAIFKKNPRRVVRPAGERLGFLVCSQSSLCCDGAALLC